MVRATDQGTIAIVKIVCYSSQEEEVAMLHRATRGNTRVGQEAGVRGIHGRELYCGSCRKERARQDKQVWL